MRIASEHTCVAGSKQNQFAQSRRPTQEGEDGGGGGGGGGVSFGIGNVPGNGNCIRSTAESSLRSSVEEPKMKGRRK